MWVREWAGDLRLKSKSAFVSVVERLVWKREKKSEWEEGVWGENKPRAAQHAAVSNKQFGVSISSQPSTWKIWISNLATACYVLWDAESFYGSVSLPFIGWKLIVELHFRSPPKIPGPGGRCQSLSPAFVLAQGGSEVQLCCCRSLLALTDFTFQVCYSSQSCFIKHHFNLSLHWEGWILSSLMEYLMN